MLLYFELFLIMCICVYVWVCAHMSAGALRVQKDCVWFSEAGVTGGGESPGMGSGNQTCSGSAISPVYILMPFKSMFSSFLFEKL